MNKPVGHNAVPIHTSWTLFFAGASRPSRDSRDVDSLRPSAGIPLSSMPPVSMHRCPLSGAHDMTYASCRRADRRSSSSPRGLSLSLSARPGALPRRFSSQYCRSFSRSSCLRLSSASSRSADAPDDPLLQPRAHYSRSPRTHLLTGPCGHSRLFPAHASPACCPPYTITTWLLSHLPHLRRSPYTIHTHRRPL
jgi:hypothetical protein